MSKKTKTNHEEKPANSSISLPDNEGYTPAIVGLRSQLRRRLILVTNDDTTKAMQIPVIF